MAAPSQQPYTLAVIGCGTMGIAILSGVLDSQRALAAGAVAAQDRSGTSTPAVNGGKAPNAADLSMSVLSLADGEDSSNPELTYLPTRYYTTVSRPESGKRLRRTFQEYNDQAKADAVSLGIKDEDGGKLVEVLVQDNLTAIKAADVVLLACKPNMVQDILAEGGQETRDALKGKLLVSICAGLRIEQMKAWVDESTTVVRAMPNTPCKIRQGMTILSSLDPRSPSYVAHRRTLLSIFSAVGKSRFLDEKHFDACTALAGSGPAFACVFLEAMADGGVMMGLPRKEALELAAQTMQGAARMVMESGMHPAAIKDSVTTPGGCTIAGLLNLEDGKVRSTVARTIQAAAEHAAGLGQTKK